MPRLRLFGEFLKAFLSTIARDATERIRAERALRESEERFRKIFEEGPLGMAIVGLDYRFVNVNTRLCRMVGYTEQELTALTFPDITHPEDIDKDVQLAQRLFRGEIRYYTMEKRYIKKSRDEIWINLTASIIRDESGMPLHFLAMIEDITERKRVEAEQERLLVELQRRADELDAVIESMAEGVTIVDAEGRIVRINRAGRERLGLPDSQSIVGMPVQSLEIDLRYPDGRPLPTEKWPAVRALRGETFLQQEVVSLRPDGSRLSLLYAGSAVRDDEGRVVMAVTVYHDITPIRELERQREEFISVVAHDLRGALTVIQGYAGHMVRVAERQSLPEQIRRSLEEISVSSRRMGRMISDLLDVSRIEAHRLALLKKPVDLSSLVQAIVHRSAELLKGHPVRVEVHGQVPIVEADPDRIEQVLSNLLSNAGKYSYPDSEITIEIAPRPEEAMVSVTNVGYGVMPEERDKLFTRFHRARQALGRDVPGLGLGLYIAKGLVEAHGGRIWVESPGQGKGSAFTFTLPVAKPRSTP